MRFSHSKLEIARKCMKQFHYKYILKYPVLDTEPTEFGNLIHEIAQNYKGSGKKELMCLYEKYRPKYKFESKTYKNKIKLALKNIHDFWQINLKNQKYEPEQEVTESLTESISLNGKIDVIIFNDNKVRIIDYKTSKTDKYSDHTNQLAMYKILVNKKYNIPYENMSCEIVYLSMDEVDKSGKHILNEGYNNIVREYDVDESDIDVLIEEIESVKHRIERAEKNNIWRANPTWFNCTYCSFNEHCDEKYKDKKDS